MGSPPFLWGRASIIFVGAGVPARRNPVGHGGPRHSTKIQFRASPSPCLQAGFEVFELGDEVFEAAADLVTLLLQRVDLLLLRLAFFC